MHVFILLGLLACHARAETTPPLAQPPRAVAERAAAGPTLVLDLRSSPPATTLAAQVCAGLLNRDAAAPPVYTLMRPEDLTWLRIVEPLLPSPPPLTALPAFFSQCFSAAAAARVIRYNFSSMQALVPNLLTLAALLDAVPLEDGSPFSPASPVLAYDALTLWAGFSPLNATAWLFAHPLFNTTTSMAKMNPGWDVHGHPLDPNPPLSFLPDLSLGDFIVKQRLFNFFLLEGCIPGTAERALVDAISLANPWPRPITVWGYDDTFPVAGDLFEAETTCDGARNMGQVATVGVNNLAYFSRAPAVSVPLPQPPPPPFTYNSSKTYLSLVVGDGDNIGMVKAARQQWVANRTARCAGGGCFPLLWTLSPHLLDAAPDLLRWFFAAGAATRRDWFVLPPSGHLYAYPALMGPADQARFVAATEADARLFSTSATVEWEFFGSWPAAFAEYLPRYAAARVVRALFAVNVPYLLPVLEFAPGEMSRVVNGSTVVFAPNEWRGTSGSADPLLHPFLLSPAEMAARISAYPRGTATALYVTSDGGADIGDVFALAAALEGSHVEIVEAEALTAAALARAGGAAR